MQISARWSINQANHSQILTISIYLKSAKIVGNKMPFGDHKHAIVYNGPANFEKILQAEVSGKYIRQLSNIQEECGDLLVMSKNFHTLEV